MAGIAACDVHIVCNSTFSIMSALLSTKDSCIIRPQKYYSGINTMPDDIFPEKWLDCTCKRNHCSYLSGILYTGYVKLRNRC